MGISENVTVGDLIEMRVLEKPNLFMCRVYHNLVSCYLEHERAYVRLGVTGKGSMDGARINKKAWPNHLITPEQEGFENVFGRFDTSRLRNVFTDEIINPNNWSRESTSFQAFEKLLEVM